MIIGNNGYYAVSVADNLQLISGRLLNTADYLSAVVDMYTIHCIITFDAGCSKGDTFQSTLFLFKYIVETAYHRICQCTACSPSKFHFSSR